MITYVRPRGEVRERFIRAVSKTVVAQVTVSSNLTLSAISAVILPLKLTGRRENLTLSAIFPNVYSDSTFHVAVSMWSPAKTEAPTGARVQPT